MLPDRERNAYYEKARAVWASTTLTDATEWKRNEFTKSVRNYLKGSQLETMESWLDSGENSEFVRGQLSVVEEIIEAMDNIVDLVKEEHEYIEQRRQEEEYESEGGRVSSYS